MSVIVKAPKGPPEKGPSKTTIDKIPPVTIISKEDEYTVVLTKTGTVPAAYPILSFDITGPPGWFYEVQVGRGYSHGFPEGPGLKSCWLETDDLFHRVHQSGFSTWTHGEKTLQLDGSGRANYTMPVGWWKDQARQQIDDFQDLAYSYRALAFKDASGTSPRFSTPNWGVAPNAILHNNLTSFSQPVSHQDESYSNTGAGAHAVLRVSNRIEVREANTWDMYCLVQWVMGQVRERDKDGDVHYASVHVYSLFARQDMPEWTVDRYGSWDPRYHDNLPEAHDANSATFQDAPGLSSIGSDNMATSWRTDFRTVAHLNCDVMGKAVKIKSSVGSLPIYDQLIGVLPDPQPADLAEIRWKVRILMYRHPSFFEISHPDDELSDPVLIDPIRIDD